MRINLTKKDIVNSLYMQIGYTKKISENLLEDVLLQFTPIPSLLFSNRIFSLCDKTGLHTNLLYRCFFIFRTYYFHSISKNKMKHVRQQKQKRQVKQYANFGQTLANLCENINKSFSFFCK